MPGVPAGAAAGSCTARASSTPSATATSCHHPFESFAPVVDFVRQARSDRARHQADALSRRQQLGDRGCARGAPPKSYGRHRASRAFRRGGEHQPRLLLQEAGAHVVYGVVGYEPRMILVVRRENGHLRLFVHLGTGNYHDRTARTPISVCSPATKHRRGRAQGIPGTDEPRARIAPQAFCNPRFAAGCWRGSSARSPMRAPDDGAYHRQTERPGGARVIQALARVPGRRADRSHRARHLLSAAACRACRQYPRALDHRPVFEHPRLLVPQRRQGKRWLASADWMERNSSARRGGVPDRGQGTARRVIGGARFTSRTTARRGRWTVTGYARLKPAGQPPHRRRARAAETGGTA